MTTQTTPDVSQEQATGTGQAPTSTPQAGTETMQQTLSHEEALAALKAARHDAASYRTRLANLERAQADAEAAKLAEQGEYQKLAEKHQRDADELRAQLVQRDHADLQREIAIAHKLPPEMAARLQGSTRDELTADAKALAKLLAQPPAAPGSAPSPRPGAPSKSLIEQETERMRASGKYSRG